MNKTIAVLIAAGVTALTMTGLGTAAIAIFADDPASPPATPVAITVSPGVDYAKREAQYQALLKQANERIQQADARLKEANARIEQANSRIQQLQGTTAAASTAAPAAAQANPSRQTLASASGEHEGGDDNGDNDDAAATITPQQAARIALRAARGTHLVQTPSLVSVDGRTVYQVLLDAGTLYLDPHSGEILAAVPNQ